MATTAPWRSGPCDAVAPWVTFAASLLGLLAFVFCIANLIGFLSGWWALAAAYPHTGHFGGTRRRFQSLLLRAGSYRNSVTIGTNAEGLYLVASMLFRIGHPPMFIPWEDISAKEVRGWFWTRYLELCFLRVPGVDSDVGITGPKDRRRRKPSLG